MKKTILLISLVCLSVIATAQSIMGNYAIKNVQTDMLLRVKEAVTM
jgi:hypothetical protein